MNGLSEAEREAASVVAGLSGKHGRGEDPDAAAGGSVAKRSRVEEMDPLLVAAGDAEPVPVVVAQPQQMHQMQQQRPPQPQPNQGDLQPYPFFYYKDYSTKPDPDSLTPLTPPGRVPNFPAKMHAILARSDLADVITWMPHGRSWKVLKPREFEVRVIPVYFEHAKFSSFIRQANGWGFRRISTGRDRNSYYHPMFLRGMPYLCKDMKRPGVSKKLAADPDHEPVCLIVLFAGVVVVLSVVIESLTHIWVSFTITMFYRTFMPLARSTRYRNDRLTMPFFSSVSSKADPRLACPFIRVS